MPPGSGRHPRLFKARALLVLVVAGLLAGASALAFAAISHRAAMPSTGIALRAPTTSTDAVAPPPLDDGIPVEPPPVQALPVSGGPGRVVDVPILMYHYIRVDQKPGDTVGFNLSVTPQDFALQMALLRASGFHTVSVHQVVAALEGKATLPSHPVVLTFDDGYADFATRAAPTMVRFGFSGTTYVVSGFVGKQGYMTLAQLHQVVAMGMTVGAHTVHHVDLAHLPGPEAQAEIDISRQTLIAMTGQPVLDFAYPYGAVSAAVAAQVQQAGFDDAVTTQEGSVHFLAQRYVLTRVRVSGGESLRAFADHLGIVGGFPGFGFGLLGAAFTPTPAPGAAVAARTDGPVAS